MKERPILFSGEMVRAILDGRKTVTRRVITRGTVGRMMHRNQRLWPYVPKADMSIPLACRYGQPGDRLWVRETFQAWSGGQTQDGEEYDIVEGRLMEDYPILQSFTYKADGESFPEWWRPSIHMPRWASRITLEVTGVRVESVQEISQESARAEGVQWCPHRPDRCGAKPWADGNSVFDCSVCGFKVIWNAINGPRGFGWDKNPWVWVVEFRRVTA